MPLFDKERLKKIQAEATVDNEHTVLIMIVDDEEHTTITLSHLLSPYYDVLTAGNGQEALELIQTHPNPEDIHLILCDQRMPRMNGVDFLEKSRAIIPNAIRIVLTAYTDIQIIIDAINRAQIYKFILKPFDKDDLLLTIQRALESYDLQRKNAELVENLQTLNAGLEAQVKARTTTLRRERDKAQLYFDFAGVMMVVIDTRQTVARINQKGVKILGYPAEEIIGKNWFDTYLPADNRERVKTAFRQLMVGEPEAIEYFESPLINKNNEERLIAWQNTLLRDENSNIIGVLSSGKDITEHKRIEVINASRLHLLQFSTTHSLEELLEETLNEAEKLTGSRIGFYHFVEDDQKSLTLQEWSTKTKAEFCKAEGMHYNIDDAGVWVDCVYQRKPVIY